MLRTGSCPAIHPSLPLEIGNDVVEKGHGIAPVTETFPMSKVNDALEHLRAGKARYRIVLFNDIASGSAPRRLWSRLS